LPVKSGTLQPTLSRGRLDLVLRDDSFGALGGTSDSVERDSVRRRREETHDFMNAVSGPVEEKHFDADKLVELKTMVHQILRAITNTHDTGTTASRFGRKDYSPWAQRISLAAPHLRNRSVTHATLLLQGSCA
jgi:hypothetical protein